MRKIYENIEFARVGHYESILNSAGIPTFVKNVGAGAAAGEIPFQQVFPELWVLEYGDYGRALEILKPYHCREIPEGSPWTCPACGEGIEGTFGECWNCQTERPGESAE